MAGPSERSPLQREAIVDAAEALVVTGGLEALSLRRLAANLGVTAPALYAHVRDKQDLLRSLAERQFDRLVATFETVKDLPPLERIRAHSRAYVDQACAEPELFRVMFLFPPELEPAEVPMEAGLPAATKAFEAASGAIAEAIAEGSIRSDDPLVTALAIWSATHGAAAVLQLGFDLPDAIEQAMVDEVVDRLLAGYRPTA